MDVKIEKKEEISIVGITGRVDSSTSKELENQLLPLVDAGTKKMVVDFSSVDFISSAGLRVLLVVTKRLNNAGGKIALCGLKDTLKEVFDISGFATIIPIFQSQDQAVASVK